MGKATGRGRGGGGNSKRSKPSFRKGKKGFKSTPLSRQESDSEGSISDEQGGLEAMLARIKGLRSDESDADEDMEDEELDSDMADTDGEDGPVVEKKPKGKASQHAEIDLNEDEPSIEPEEDGMVDLSTMLDLHPPEQEESDSDDSAGFSEDEDEEEDSANEDAVDKLNSFIQALPGQQADADADEGPSKKRKLAERTETQPESEFAPLNNSKKLRLEDMLASLPASQAKQVKKSIKPILKSQDADRADASVLNRAGALPAPLDSRSQAKLDRKIARDQLDGEVDKWNPTVAESAFLWSSHILTCSIVILTHVLSRTVRGIGSKDSEFGQHRITLPLNAPDLKARPSAAELTSKFKVRLHAIVLKRKKKN